MWEQSVCALQIHRLLESELGLAVLLGDNVVSLDLDCPEGIMTKMQYKTIRKIKHHHRHQEDKQDTQFSHDRLALMISKSWEESQSRLTHQWREGQ
jgi:hypothetical protein